jgi:molybdate transport system substrate-binding protein
MTTLGCQHARFVGRVISALVCLWAVSGHVCADRSPAYRLRTAQALAQAPVTGDLTVFAAASLTEAFAEIGKRLELFHPGLRIMYNFTGSPALRMQLEQGAHADVFASADTVQMDHAKKSNLVRAESSILVKNRLVAIVPQA